ncbi:MAG: ABC transporter permease, partial [Rhodobacteraceae bacterium]|nr:ABC transporter permease [Paracoccaceae bacterium]
MTQNPDTYSAAGEVGAVLEKRTFWTRLKLDLK